MIYNRKLSRSNIVGTRRLNNLDQETYRKLYNKYILRGGGNDDADKATPLGDPETECTDEKECTQEQSELKESVIEKGDVSRVNTYTIPCGTILYHGSASQQSFDPENIQLGTTTLIAFFSTNQKIAEENFAKCSKYTEDNKGGYMHRFIVTKDIDNILILSKYEIKTLDPKKLEDQFCTRGRNKYDKVLNGIGYFFPKEGEDGQYDNEFALCTTQGLEHWGYKMCLGPHELAKDWVFLEGENSMTEEEYESTKEQSCKQCEEQEEQEELEEPKKTER